MLKRVERGSDSVRTPFLHFMNTGVIRSEIYWGGGVLPGSTFRFFLLLTSSLFVPL
nr:MAG TPA: hypothetical protein [Caudoviricetes sp.]